jgi:tetratricopeptide (TPR) repeat protein
MKRYYKIIILLVGVFLFSSVNAQRSKIRTSSTAKKETNTPARPKSDVVYTKKYMKQEGDSLVIDMDIDMSKLKIKTNFAHILTPVIGSEDNEIELPRVMIQGTARNKAFIRELELNDKAYNEFENNLPYAIVKPQGMLNYRIAVPYEPWMSEAYLGVEEDLCGCGDESKLAYARIYDGLTKDVPVIPVYKVSPQLVYIQPEVEAVKKRKEIANAYLDFPRGKNEILPNFGNNPVELAKIDNMIKTITTNSDITVERVFMIGYASPESSLAFNTNLSRSRAESLMRYFMKDGTISGSLFETRTGGEDWEGLHKLLQEYPVARKEEIFQIMNMISDLDRREAAIRALDGGRPYKIIYEELYPRLRRVVCEINYTVKDFSIEEAKENFKFAPQLLSLNEMYILANQYEAGSPEFLKVFEVAREEFPDDPVANLNGAAVALSKNNVRDAEKYLRLSDPSTPEYHNNMGVYQMLRGNYKEADKHLKEAEKSGLNVARHNMGELRKKIANENNRREAGVVEEEVKQPARRR